MSLRPLPSAGQAADRQMKALHLRASTGSSQGRPGHGPPLDLLRKLPGRAAEHDVLRAAARQVIDHRFQCRDLVRLRGQPPLLFPIRSACARISASRESAGGSPGAGAITARNHPRSRARAPRQMPHPTLKCNQRSPPAAPVTRLPREQQAKERAAATVRTWTAGRPRPCASVRGGTASANQASSEAPAASCQHIRRLHAADLETGAGVPA